MYQFVYQADREGVYAGSHAIKKYGDLPVPLNESELPEIISAINTAAIARADALADTLRGLNAQHAAAIAAIEARHAKAIADAEAAHVAAMATFKAEADQFRAGATTAALKADQVIKNPAIDAETTVVIVGEIVRQVLQPRVERELEAALKAVADAQALVDKLQGKAP